MMSRVIYLTATDDTGAADPTITITDGVSGLNHSLASWWLYRVSVKGNHAGTEPTQDSDITMTEDGADLFEGQGVNAVDNDATNFFFPQAVPHVDDWVLTITGNSVNGAVTYVRLLLYGEKN
jgi:hypothetical protein